MGLEERPPHRPSSLRVFCRKPFSSRHVLSVKGRVRPEWDVASTHCVPAIRSSLAGAHGYLGDMSV